jgi:hypothetical protein
MTNKSEDVTKGVENAWDFWLSQHDITVPAAIENAVGTAFGAWLNAHSDELIAAIAVEVAKRNGGTI